MYSLFAHLNNSLYHSFPSQQTEKELELINRKNIGYHVCMYSVHLRRSYVGQRIGQRSKRSKLLGEVHNHIHIDKYNLLHFNGCASAIIKIYFETR